MTRFAAVGAVVMLSVVLGSGTVNAQAVRNNWLQVGFSLPGRILGDLWTFNCPAGGSFEVLVDTMEGGAIDPAVSIFDGRGNRITGADDDVACTNNPCTGSCPFAQGSCGTGSVHSIAVFNPVIGGTCTGGGYRLVVNVFDQRGQQLTESAIRLGGGPARRVPAWAVAEGAAPAGPALDDEFVPR
jgi:hypothetical protein